MAAYSDLTDRELTVLLKLDDAHAFAEIFDRYQRVLYRHAYNWLQDSEAVKDAIQDLFTAVWDKRSSITYQENLSGYLYAALRNRILRQIKLSKHHDTYLGSLGDQVRTKTSITDYLIREKQLKAIIEKEVAALPEKMREVFELSRNAHLSHAEIAEQLGISELTVKTQVKNALRILRTKLGIVLYMWMLLFY